MLYVIYSIFDKLAKQFSLPRYAVNEDVAMREFKLFVDSVKSDKDDFVLYKLGVYDVESGSLNSCEPIIICHGGDFVNVEA